MTKIEEIKEKIRELKPLLQEKYKVSEIGIFSVYMKRNRRLDKTMIRNFLETIILYDIKSNFCK